MYLQLLYALTTYTYTSIHFQLSNVNIEDVACVQQIYILSGEF